MKKRSGLGRGLDALLPQAEPDDAVDRAGLERVPIGSIDPNPRQPRDAFDPEELAELTVSVKELGVLQPLLVRRAGDRLELIAGERRLRAAKQAGLDEVPVMVVETDDKGSLERALVENIHRSNLNPIEEATAYRDLIQEGDLTQEQLAEQIGKNRVSITNLLRLLDLPPALQSLLADRRLTAGHGKALLALEGNPFQEKLARRAAQEKMSVRETEDMVRRYQAMSGTSSGGSRAGASRPPEVSEAQRRLSDHLQTRVRVDMGQRKGKVTIDFSSVDELERLLQVIIGDNRGEGPRVVSPS
jgi:ParB family chromosome partitioning protein